jgi:hypothetical protein
VDAAWIDGETLHIEVTENNSKIKSILEFNLSDYAENTEHISIQAVDLDGNKSKIVRIKNPNYIPPKSEESADISAISEPTQSNSDVFTPDGNGSVLDNISDSNGKEFFTITTDNKNTFYLIIDRQRNSENVYLLNSVTEDDLFDFVRKNANIDESTIPTTELITQPKTTVEIITEVIETPVKEEKNTNNTGTIIFIGLAVIAVGGAGYYFKIYKKKQQNNSSNEDDMDEENYDDTPSDESDESDEDGDEDD